MNFKLIVLYSEWLKKREYDALLYSSVCICHATRLRCAGHVVYKDTPYSDEQLWPERQVKRMEEETIEVTISYGRQRVLTSRTSYAWWDVEEQASYGPNFETRAMADKFRTWLAGRDPRTYDTDQLELYYALFRIGFPGLEPVVAEPVTEEPSTEEK